MFANIFRILCETIKEFIGKMAGLHAADDNASSLASGDESIAQKCRVLNEKLDQLLGTLHEEASPLHVGTPRASVDEEESPDNVESSVRYSSLFCCCCCMLTNYYCIHILSLLIRNIQKC